MAERRWWQGAGFFYHRWRHISFVILLLIILGTTFLLQGCGKQAVAINFPEAADRITGMYLDFEEPGVGYKRVGEVRDERILSVLKEKLAAAKPADPPEKWPWETYALSFELSVKGEVGETPRYTYWYKRFQPGEPGYIRFAGGWFQTPGEFNTLLHSLTEYRNASGNIDPADEAFLKKYGWTPLFLITRFDEILPPGFIHRPGEFPVVLYWAFNNELNKDIGLDLTPYLGKKVTVRLYKTVDLLPQFMEPRRETGRVVVVCFQEKIIGAWLDAGRHDAFACSLNGRRLEEITGKTWEEWISALIDPQDPFEQKLAPLTPEELLRTYFDAVDRGDFRLAYACENRKRLAHHYLFSNMDNNKLYNQDYPAGGLKNITRARVISLKHLPEGEKNYPPGTLLYQVEVDLGVRRFITHESGPQRRFITLRKETAATGWRIESIGTGP